MKASLLVVSAALFLCGCTSTAPGWESRFGDAARQARASQVIDVDAPSRVANAQGTDGKAAAGAMKAYAESYGYAVKEAKTPAVSISTNIGR
jgi:hypothetical protein